MKNAQFNFNIINRYCYVDHYQKFVLIKLKKNFGQLRFYLFRSEQTIRSGDNDKDGKSCGVVYIDLTEKVDEGNISDQKKEGKEKAQSMTMYYN